MIANFATLSILILNINLFNIIRNIALSVYDFLPSSQRARINFNYRSPRVNFQASVQDIRVWGADASTINNADGSRLSLHEAWTDIILANTRDSAFARSPLEWLS